MLSHLEEEVQQEQRQQHKIKDVEGSKGVNKSDCGVRIIPIVLIFPLRRAQRNGEDFDGAVTIGGDLVPVKGRAPKFKERLFFDLGGKDQSKEWQRMRKKKKTSMSVRPKGVIVVPVV